jgi:ribosomal protein L14E/L6E/L27E
MIHREREINDLIFFSIINSSFFFLKHFNKFVQVGRVAVIAIGPQEGKLCVILDIIDQNRVSTSDTDRYADTYPKTDNLKFFFVCLKALIEGPFHGVVRQAINFKVLHLTKFCLRIPHSARQATVKKQWIKAEIDKKWSETQWAKKQAAKALVSSVFCMHSYALLFPSSCLFA